MRIAFAGCSRELPKSLILHFMKVKGGALKISDWNDADIGVIGEDDANLNALGVAGKQWIIMPGDSAAREGNTIRLPKDNWQQTLVGVVENIVLGRSEQLGSAAVEARSVALAPPARETAPQLQPAAPAVPAPPAEYAVSIPPSVDSTATDHSAYWQGVEQVFSPQDYPLLGILKKYSGRHLAIIFDQQRSLRIVGDLVLMRLSKSAFKVFCQTKDIQGWRVEEIKERQVEGLLREANTSDDVDVIPVEKLLWDVAHSICSGRRNQTATAEQTYSLRHYPDFNRVEARDSSIRMAAFLHSRPLTAVQLCALSGASPQDVSDFLFALDVGDYLGDHKRQAMRANDANTGVFRKLMNKFAFGRS